jgi:hypothetical protein
MGGECVKYGREDGCIQAFDGEGEEKMRGKK